MAQMQLLEEETQANSHMNNNSNNKTHNSYKSSNPKRPTPEITLEDDHERLVEYVDTDFKGKDIPKSEDEMREHIQKSFEKDPQLRFLYTNNKSSYSLLIDDVFQTTQYQNALKNSQTNIQLKNRKKQRKGFIVNNRLFFILVERKSKTGETHRYRRYYNTKDGKQVKTKNIHRYSDKIPIRNKNIEVDEMKSRKKERENKISIKYSKQKPQEKTTIRQTFTKNIEVEQEKKKGKPKENKIEILK